jgi:hypothetical protein
LHDAYSDAFRSYLSTLSANESDNPSELLFDRFCGRDNSEISVFMNFRHFWSDVVFKSDGISVSHDAKNVLAGVDQRVVRTESKEVLFTQYRSPKPRTQTQVIDGKSAMWLPNMSEFLGKPVGLIDSFEIGSADITATEAGENWRYNNLRIDLIVSQKTRSATYLKLKARGLCYEAWYFGRMPAEDTDGIFFRRLGFTLSRQVIRTRRLVFITSVGYRMCSTRYG